MGSARSAFVQGRRLSRPSSASAAVAAAWHWLARQRRHATASSTNRSTTGPGSAATRRMKLWWPADSSQSQSAITHRMAAGSWARSCTRRWNKSLSSLWKRSNFSMVVMLAMVIVVDGRARSPNNKKKSVEVWVTS